MHTYKIHNFQDCACSLVFWIVVNQTLTASRRTMNRKHLLCGLGHIKLQCIAVSTLLFIDHASTCFVCWVNKNIKISNWQLLAAGPKGQSEVVELKNKVQRCSLSVNILHLPHCVFRQSTYKRRRGTVSKTQQNVAFSLMLSLTTMCTWKLFIVSWMELCW